MEKKPLSKYVRRSLPVRHGPTASSLARLTWIDLTEASGFTDDKKRQFASIGGEINAWSWAQLRAGYRQNMASSDGSAFTAGIGISPFDVVHLDLTGIAGTDRTYGAVAQLSFTF